MLDDPIFNSYQQDHRYSSPKVVPMPIHFVSSNESAALKIQKVFRGFLVRKSVKKISSIRNEVCEVERSINDTETVELIRVDVKERLRVNETLMSLLFKLDSIRGFDFGVRDLRKAVIRKAIALQEMVDSIVVSRKGSAEIDCQIVCQVTSEQVQKSSSYRLRDQVLKGSVNFAADTDSVMNAEGVIDAKMEVTNEIDVNCNPVPDDDKKRSMQILETLMDDNEKMMTLMSQMFERNEMQTRMINSLSQRVEQLEKTFICDKSRKKKKRRHSA